MHEKIFVKRPKFLAGTSNFRAEQNLVHLGRFLRFSQKVVGVTLSNIFNFITFLSFYSPAKIRQTKLDFKSECHFRSSKWFTDSIQSRAPLKCQMLHGNEWYQ